MFHKQNLFLYFPRIFANAGNSRNIDHTWKRKEPQRGLPLLYEFPRAAAFQPQQFRSKKNKNGKEEKTRRFFARIRCSKIVWQSSNQFFKAAMGVTDVFPFINMGNVFQFFSFLSLHQYGFCFSLPPLSFPIQIWVMFFSSSLVFPYINMAFVSLFLPCLSLYKYG